MKLSKVTVQVFISSTFRDMHDERDYLVKYVFPELRKRLDAYHVDFMDIDLRWGITEQQAEDGRVLDLCLQSIEESRPGKGTKDIPFFIGLLGQRYGWVPDDITEEALSRQPWLQEEHARGRSMTELEIMQAVLNNPDMQGHAFFYFRHPESLDKVPENKLWRYTDPDNSQEEMLNDLKERIQGSNYPVKVFSANWNGSEKNRHFEATETDDGSGRLINFMEAEGNERHFYELVIEDLWGSIKEELDLPEEPRRERTESTLQREEDFHRRFIENRLNGVSKKVRSKLQQTLKGFVDGNSADEDRFDFSKPLMLTGAQGSGKSTVMAGLANDLQQQINQQERENLLVISHFAGASPSSTTLRDLLTRIVEILGEAYQKEYETGVEMSELISTFREALKAVPDDDEVVLIVDAINQFADRDGAKELRWLPYELPQNVKVVLSTIDSEEQTTIPAKQARLLQHNILEVQPLSIEERKIILRDVPAIAAKTLSDKQMGELLNIDATKNPLYLRVALEEMRGYGTHDTLDKQIDDFQNSGRSQRPLRAIFVQVFKRLEEQFDPGGTSLTREVLSLLGTARRGLTEVELADLTGGLDNSGDLMYLLRHLRPYLMRRGPIITFFHDALFDAVNHHYLDAKEKKHTYHQKVATYFEKKDNFENGYTSEDRIPNQRKVDELPYHLLKLKQSDELAGHLKELSFVEAKVVSGLVIDLAEDYQAALKQQDPGSSNYTLLNVLSRAIHSEISFLIRQPALLFQVCWNKGWWYDAPETAKYAAVADYAPEGYEPPWERDEPKVSTLLEAWKTRFEAIPPPKVWVKKILPSRDVFGVKNKIMRGHKAPVRHSAWSPDGTRLATASQDETARVWDPAGQAPPVVLEGHKDYVQHVAWSPDGTRLATASWDSTARVWELAGQAPPVVLVGHEDYVLHVAWSPDGSRLATTSHDGTARVWDPDGEALPVVLKVHKSRVNHVAWSPDGTRLGTASWDGIARVWDLAGQAPPVVLEGHEERINHVAWSPDGTRLATAAEDGTARIWDPTGQTPPVVFEGHKKYVLHVAWSPDGTRLATASNDGTARIWDLAGQATPVILSGHQSGLWHVVAWSPDGTRLATASPERTARVWDSAGQTPPVVLEGHEEYVMHVAWSPDGTRLATTSHDGTARVWDPVGQASPVVMRGHINRIIHVVWSPDGTRLATASVESTARVWDPAEQSPPVILKGHEEMINHVAWSLDGTRLATASNDGTARVWDPAGQAPPVVLVGHEAFVVHVAWSPDGTRLATASWDGTARVWDLAGRATHLLLEGHKGAVQYIAWSPDGTRLATVSGDLTACVWDPAGQAPPVVLIGHEKYLTDVAWSPDGTCLATASEDGTARVWDPAGISDPVVLRGHNRLVAHVAWSPDGTRLATASGDGTSRVWDLSKRFRDISCKEFHRSEFGSLFHESHHSEQHKYKISQLGVELQIDYKESPFYFENSTVKELVKSNSAPIWAGMSGSSVIIFKLENFEE